MLLTLADILEALTGTRPVGTELVITEASIDSRLSIPGSLFVAMSGERVDGHNYVGDAFHKGAHLALIQKDLSSIFPVLDLTDPSRPLPDQLPKVPFCILVKDTLLALQQIAAFWRSRLNVQVIGITGSVGKSTTKELIADMLAHKFRTLRNPGNLNNEIDLPLTILRLGSGYQYAVLEMGFYVPGEIALLCGIARPQVGVVTNIGTVHAERAGSQEVIARGKSELVKALPEDGTAILNYDDPWVRPMAQVTRAGVLTYGLDPQADLWASHVTGQGLDGIQFDLHHKTETFQLRVPLIGQHSVHTVLRAAAVGVALGMSWDDIISGLRFSRTQLRLVAVHATNGAMILDDTYNASPESTLAALNLLEEMDGRKVAVLGDMLELGPYEIEGHEKVGIRAAEVARQLITLGERGRIIARAAREDGLSEKHILALDEPQQAVDFLKSFLLPDDVVLVKGSHGMRMDKIVSALEGES